MIVRILKSESERIDFQARYARYGHPVGLDYLRRSRVVVFLPDGAAPVSAALAGFCVHTGGPLRYLKPFEESERAAMLTTARLVPANVVEIGCFFFHRSVPAADRIWVSVRALVYALGTGKPVVMFGTVDKSFAEKLRAICAHTFYEGAVGTHSFGLICFGSRGEVARNLIVQTVRQASRLAIRHDRPAARRHRPSRQLSTEING